MYKLFIFTNLLNYTYTTFTLQKIPNFISFLICLNKLKINIGLLIFFYMIYTFVNRRALVYSLYILSVTWKSKFILFIKLFFFGFFKTHLLIFYSAVLLISFMYITTTITLKFKNATKMYMVLLAFILGGRWALYLYNWGYYWTNDSIEYIMLFFLIIITWKLHKIQFITYHSAIIIILPIYSLILLRFNFIFTKHNFFQQNKLSYWFLKIILLFLLSQISLQFSSFYNKFFTINFNLILCVYILLNYLVCSNKINYITIQKTIYCLNVVLIFFFVINFIVIKQFKLLSQHWLLMYAYILLIYVSTIYYIIAKYTPQINSIYNQFYNTYNFYLKIKLYVYNLNNLQILKNNNSIYSQQLGNIFVSKKFLNFFN